MFKDKIALMAAIGVFIVMAGVTVSSEKWGAGSPLYYICILAGLGLSIPLFISKITKSAPIAAVIILILALPLLIYTIHYSLGLISHNALSYFTLYASVSLVITITISASLLDSKLFMWMMILTVAAHIILCLHGFFSYGANISATDPDSVRFSTLDMEDNTRGLSVASWGEIALGSYFAAVLTKKWFIIVPSVIIFGIVMFKTQTRATEIPCIFTLILYATLLMKPKGRIITIVSLVILCLVVLTFYRNTAYYYAEKILLIEDQNRGIESGFSGRFELNQMCINRIMDSPIIGCGMDDPVNRTHCGYLMFLAEFGAINFLAYFTVICLALFKSVKTRRYELTACITGYMLFLLVAPRDINFQIMPFVTIIALSRALFIGTKLDPDPKHMLPRRRPFAPMPTANGPYAGNYAN
jgi:hypothetical protein